MTCLGVDIILRTRDPFLTDKRVPYVATGALPEVRSHLPSSYKSPLSAQSVNAFVEETREAPEVRLAILTVLRSHASNGAEVPLSGVALMIAAFAVLAAGQSAFPLFAWILGVVLVFVTAGILKMASAAHIRRLTATVWLSAYEDALRGRRGQ